MTAHCTSTLGINATNSYRLSRFYANANCCVIECLLVYVYRFYVFRRIIYVSCTKSAIIIISLFVLGRLTKGWRCDNTNWNFICAYRDCEQACERKQITESVLVKNERGAVKRSANRITLIREWCAKLKKNRNLI